MNRPTYYSDLSDLEWAKLEREVPAGKPGGHPRRVNIREVLNAIFYLQRSGCAGATAASRGSPLGARSTTTFAVGA